MNRIIKLFLATVFVLGVIGCNSSRIEESVTQVEVEKNATSQTNETQESEEGSALIEDKVETDYPYESPEPIDPNKLTAEKVAAIQASYTIPEIVYVEVPLEEALRYEIPEYPEIDGELIKLWENRDELGWVLLVDTLFLAISTFLHITISVPQVA
ncbi:MAG: hypothetical protein R2883_06455 [Caldisericia bacterium]